MVCQSSPERSAPAVWRGVTVLHYYQSSFDQGFFSAFALTQDSRSSHEKDLAEHDRVAAMPRRSRPWRSMLELLDAAWSAGLSGQLGTTEVLLDRLPKEEGDSCGRSAANSEWDKRRRRRGRIRRRHGDGGNGRDCHWWVKRSIADEMSHQLESTRDRASKFFDRVSHVHVATTRPRTTAFTTISASIPTPHSLCRCCPAMGATLHRQRQF